MRFLIMLLCISPITTDYVCIIILLILDLTTDCCQPTTTHNHLCNLPPQSRGPITGRPGRLSGCCEYNTILVCVISDFQCGLVSPLIANVLL